VGVIYLWFFLLLCFTLCHFVTKSGSSFFFLTEIVFFNRSSVFVPELPKGEFVGL
jgi:hypothetical protein